MPEIKDITDYLKSTVQMKASDLHICTNAPPASRVDGKLVALENFDLSKQNCKNLIFSALTEKQRSTLEENLELDFAFNIENIGRFRGNAHYCRGNIEGTFRHINEEIPSLDDLGHYEIVHKLCNLRRGLILVTGVTGSGKSTTLAAMIKKIAQKRSEVVITIEDPIEYIFNHSFSLIKQREIGTDTKSFPIALKQAMRQDPDVIVVSELRDLETIQTAITAAETGHLVLATLHTKDAPQSLDRLIDVFPADQQPQIITQIANVLEAVISQRLILNSEENDRVLATEVMIMNYAIRAVLRDRKPEQIIGLIQIGAKAGMHSIDDCLLDLLENNSISPQEALNHCRDKNLFKSKL